MSLTWGIFLFEEDIEHVGHEYISSIEYNSL